MLDDYGMPGKKRASRRLPQDGTERLMKELESYRPFSDAFDVGRDDMEPAAPYTSLPPGPPPAGAAVAKKPPAIPHRVLRERME